MKIEGHWNLYYCGLCEVDFAISEATDKGDSSCPKCESGEEVCLVNKDLVERD